MPKPTFHNLPDDKRARIVEAALEEFASVPFEAASVNRIVRAAGIAKGSFYQYFEGMVDLYRHLVLVEMSERKMAFVHANPPPEGLGFFGQLAHAAVTGIRWGMQQPRMSAAARHLWYPASPESALKPLQDEIRGMRQHGLRLMLEGGQATGAVRPGLDLDMAAALMQVLLQQGLDALMLERCGVDTMTLCSEPELAAHVTDDVLRDVVGALVGQLSQGLGTGEDTGHMDMEGLQQLIFDSRDG